jgi:hypothetical protein
MDQAGGDTLADMVLPGIVIQTNPTIGLAQVESWFWVDRATYNGQPYSQTTSLPAPWTLDWDYLVHHHDAVNGPCPGNPGESCVVGFHDWDETLHGHEDHLDMATATVTLTPAQFAWDFGDDADGPPRADSHVVLPGGIGMGSPYVGPFSPSPVAHKYRESSRLVFDQGGFDVHLQVHWTASATASVTRDGALIQSETRNVGERVGNYDTLVQVREAQPVSVAGQP